MNNRIIDLLTTATNKTTGDIYAIFNPTTKNWDISTRSAVSGYIVTQIDRSNVKESIATIVNNQLAGTHTPTH